MAGKFDAYILEVEGRFMVRPAVAAVEQAAVFKIRNLTGFDATVDPDDAVKTGKVQIAAGGWGQFHVNPAADGVYQYEVWLHLGDTDLRVNGESDPVIIIDPPGN